MSICSFLAQNNRNIFSNSYNWYCHNNKARAFIVIIPTNKALTTQKRYQNQESDSSEAEEQVRQPVQEQIVPVLEEDYSIWKQTSIKEAKIEKRAVTKTKTVKIPITYEQLYINGKKLKSVEEPLVHYLWVEL